MTTTHTPRRPRHARGATLLEAMTTGVVLLLGILAAAYTVVSITRLNRRNLSQAQASAIAEWRLEQVVAGGCDIHVSADFPCANLLPFDGTAQDVWWSANGQPTTEAPAAGDPVRRRYRVVVDVDGAGIHREGDELGVPALNRVVHGVTLSDTVNVRVSVSWQEEPAGPYRVVALQTRVSP